jgi:LmbE family N-acetylglucosaminyl deacetylase
MEGSQAAFDRLRRVAIVAPHPDDESLGCGGLIALLRDAGRPVTVIFVSDGAASHPGSRRYPPAALRRLREAEGREAASILRVLPGDSIFLGLPDAMVPAATADPRFAPVAERLADLFEERGTDTVAVTTRNDPHRDHQASYALVEAAVRRLTRPILLLEYAIWAENPWTPADRLWRIDIGPVLERKKAAIACHRSQLTNLIDDVGDGVRLAPAMLARFESPFETFRVRGPDDDQALDPAGVFRRAL